MLPWLLSGILALALAVVALVLGSRVRRIRTLEDKLAQSAHLDLDPLTGLLNRTALDKRLGEDAQFPGVVIVIDLDNFKMLNDSQGHLAGDEILRNIGKLIQSSIRQEDTAFRWGGDEFVILFQNSDPQVADVRMRGLAERLRRFHLRSKGPLEIRFSWGIAPIAGRSLRESLEVADRIMLEAKRARAR